MKFKMIGISGPARVGKDTAAIRIKLNSPEQNYEIISFAEPIKKMLMIGLGLSTDQVLGGEKDIVDKRYGITPRRLMQTLGTEWGRDMIDPDLWVKVLKNQVETEGGNYLIPDVRMESEADFIRENGLLIHIKGKNTIKSSHSSESGIYIDVESDIIIDNNGTLEDYYAKLDFVNDWITKIHNATNNKTNKLAD